MSNTQKVTETEDYMETIGDVQPNNESVGPVNIGDSDHDFVGQFFYDKGFDRYFVVKYIDRDVVLKQRVNDNGKLFGYSMEKRIIFDKQYNATSKEAGYNKASEEDALDDPYGKKKEQKEKEAQLADQITDVSDFSQIKGMGQSKVDEFVEKYDTLEDVRNASNEELGNISGVGRTLIERIRDEVGGPVESEDSDSEEENEETENEEETVEEPQETESKELNENTENIEEEGESNDQTESDESEDSDDGWNTLLNSDDSDWSMDSL